MLLTFVLLRFPVHGVKATSVLPAAGTPVTVNNIVVTWSPVGVAQALRAAEAPQVVNGRAT